METKLQKAADFILKDANLTIAGQVLRAYYMVSSSTVLQNLTGELTDFNEEMLNYIPKEHYTQTYFYEVMKNFLGTNIEPNPLAEYLLSAPDEYLKNQITGNLADKYEALLRQILYLRTLVRVKNMTLSDAARVEIVNLINPGNIREVQSVIDDYEKDVKLKKPKKNK